MSIASEITRLQGAKADIKSAIEAKGVTVPSDATLDGYGDYIEQISGGGGSNFDDWVKNGDTHLWIEIIRDEQLAQTIRIRMIGTIDWGDGTSKDTANVTSYTTFSHTYTEKGRYRIDLHPTSGTFYLGGGGSSYCVMGSRTSARYHVIASLYQAEIGTSQITTISNYAFYYCCGVRKIYIPKTITTIGTYAFYDCWGMNEIICEDSSTITSTGMSNTFYNCYNLQEMSSYYLPKATSLSATYRYCYSLAEIVLQPTLTSIAANSLANCYSLKKLICLPTSAPSVANSNAFTGLPSGCVIQVPIGSLSSYQGASDWSTYSSQMEEAGTITQTLTNVVSSNKALMVDKNSSYTTTLTADEGKTLGTVTVKMGGTDITSTAYSAGVVSIASVTGNIVITASAS